MTSKNAKYPIGSAIRRVFPRGTSTEAKKQKTASILSPPISPIDMFAVAGYLLVNSSAYHRIVAADAAEKGPEGSILITKRQQDAITKAASNWRLRPQPLPSLVKKNWNKLIAAQDEPLCDLSGTAKKTAPWWRAAHILAAVADEAARDVGYLAKDDGVSFESWVVAAEFARYDRRHAQGATPDHVRLKDNFHSLTTNLVDQDVVCVQPKARTPDVGCSMRNLSHNLALLPPKGVIQIHWHHPPERQPSEATTPLNLLAVPFPFRFDTSWLELGSATNPEKWSWFNVKQDWLRADPTQFIAFIEALLEATKPTIIHGLILPEYALDYKTYEKLAETLRDKYPSIQMLVSGSSENCSNEKGNFALSSQFYDVILPNGDKKRQMSTMSRAKHHRWRLDYPQLKAYDLLGALPHANAEQCVWWEKIRLNNREVHITPIRDDSVYSVMICEDLARTDPAHEPLRSIGPNLVFVLLMDGPQLEYRWASRYATGLADDPGSSVLTLTSRALVEGWNKTRTATTDRSWSIGIWKDEKNRAEVLTCSPDHQAVLIELKGETAVEWTLDGRTNRRSSAWIRTKSTPVGLDPTLHRDLLSAVSAINP